MNKDQKFWHRQDTDKPLFPDVEWEKPELRSARGKLLIVGGSGLGFRAVVTAHQSAIEAGAGEARIALPITLKKTVPPTTDAIFLPTNPSGGFSRDGFDELRAAVAWSNGTLFVGDSGGNSETAVLFEKLLGVSENWLTFARDAVDLVRPIGEPLINRPRTHLVLSMSQAQKLFTTVYYPKILTFSMQLAQVVDALHKFTVTYPVTLTLFHADHLITAHDGEVVTMPCDAPARIWSGELAARASAYLLWSPTKPLAAIATSWLY